MADVSVERAAAAAPAVANPAPLGLSAFALTTFVLSASNAQFLFLTFLALTIGWLGGIPAAGTGSLTWVNIGGWLGIVTALLAWYTALAAILDAGPASFRLPTFPRS